ncbi:MAG TPA: head-tail connector protein [Gemmatimonadaceae bacterium]
MALPTGEDLKTYLRIETDAEDGLCDELVESATAHAESLIGRPIEPTQKTFASLRSIRDEYGRSVIYLPEYPVSLNPALVLKDENDDTVSAGDYTVVDSGRITSVAGKSFASWPYQATATVGLALSIDYERKYEPMLRTLILGLASIAYKQRDPNVTNDSNLGVSWASNENTEGLPPYLYSIVRKLRPPRIR